MELYKVTDGEFKFADLVWMNEPINSTALAKLALVQLGWKKATTYTVLRKLCEKGILKNDNAIVTAIVKKDQISKQESEALLQKNFGNSLPAFIASFIEDVKLSKDEAEQIKRMIDEATRKE